MAIKNVHFVKGTLLDYDSIFLAEGPWPGKAYHDAENREMSRSLPQPLNYASSVAPVVSLGPHAQHVDETVLVNEDLAESQAEEFLPLEAPAVDSPERAERSN